MTCPSGSLPSCMTSGRPCYGRRCFHQDCRNKWAYREREILRRNSVYRPNTHYVVLNFPIRYCGEGASQIINRFIQRLRRCLGVRKRDLFPWYGVYDAQVPGKWPHFNLLLRYDGSITQEDVFTAWFQVWEEHWVDDDDRITAGHCSVSDIGVSVEDQEEVCRYVVHQGEDIKIVPKYQWSSRMTFTGDRYFGQPKRKKIPKTTTTKKTRAPKKPTAREKLWKDFCFYQPYDRELLELEKECEQIISHAAVPSGVVRPETPSARPHDPVPYRTLLPILPSKWTKIRRRSPAAMRNSAPERRLATSSPEWGKGWGKVYDKELRASVILMYLTKTKPRLQRLNRYCIWINGP